MNKLLNLIEIEDLNDRKEAVESWVKDHLIQLEMDHSVIKSNFTTEETDFIKYYLAQQLSEKIMESFAEVETTKNNIKVKVMVYAK